MCQLVRIYYFSSFIGRFHTECCFVLLIKSLPIMLEYIDGGYHNRILLALKSGLPNEVDWAVLRLLSVSCTSDDFFLPSIPGLVPILVSLCDDYISNACREDLDAITVANPLGLQRLTLILNALRNLSFSSPSFYLLVPFRSFFVKILNLPSHVLEPKLLALDILENVAFVLPIDPDDQYNIIGSLTACISTSDRAFVISALRGLARLAINDNNEMAFAAAVSPALLEHLCALLTLVEDSELCLAVLEYLYQTTQISSSMADSVVSALPSHAARLVLRCIMRVCPRSRAFDAPSSTELQDSPIMQQKLRHEMFQRLESFSALDTSGLQACKISSNAATCAPVLFWLRWRIEPCIGNSTPISELVADLNSSTLFSIPLPGNNNIIQSIADSPVHQHFQNSPRSQQLQTSESSILAPISSLNTLNPIYTIQSEEQQDQIVDSNLVYGPPSWMRSLDTELMMKIILSVCPNAVIRDNTMMQGVQIRTVVTSSFVLKQLSDFYKDIANTSDAEEKIVLDSLRRTMQQRFGARKFCKWRECSVKAPFDSDQTLREHILKMHGAMKSGGSCAWSNCNHSPMSVGHLYQHIGPAKLITIYDDDSDNESLDFNKEKDQISRDGVFRDDQEYNYVDENLKYEINMDASMKNSGQTLLPQNFEDQVAQSLAKAPIDTESKKNHHSNDASVQHNFVAVQQQIANEISIDPTGLPFTAALVLRNLFRTSKSDILFDDVSEEIVLACARYPRISKCLMWSLG